MRPFALPLALLVLTGRADAQGPVFQELPVVQELALADHVVVSKSQRTIVLRSGGEVLHVIGGVQLGDDPVGHKRFQGDQRTPEGRYTIDYGNPDSAFHLSLHISYPNEADSAFAHVRGRSPGGLIFIHGQPNGYAGRMRGDWTDGCIAVSNAEMELMWELVPDGTPIDILP